MYGRFTSFFLLEPVLGLALGLRLANHGEVKLTGIGGSQRLLKDHIKQVSKAKHVVSRTASYVRRNDFANTPVIFNELEQFLWVECCPYVRL